MLVCYCSPLDYSALSGGQELRLAFQISTLCARLHSFRIQSNTLTFLNRLVSHEVCLNSYIYTYRFPTLPHLIIQHDIPLLHVTKTDQSRWPNHRANTSLALLLPSCSKYVNWDEKEGPVSCGFFFIIF